MCLHQQSRFLFVNKSARSRSLSNSFDTDAAAISRHVQPPKHKRRQGLSPSVSPSTRKIAREAWKKKPDFESASHSTSDGGSPFEVSEMKDTDVSTSELFGGIHPPLETRTINILRYFLKYGIMSTYRIEMNMARDNRGVPHRYASVARDIVKACLESSMHMNALVASTASRMALTMPQSEGLVQQAHESEQLALRDMQSWFSTLEPDRSIDIHVLLDILHLCVGNWLRGEYNAAAVHLNALQHLVHKANSKDERYNYLIESMFAYDVFLAIDTGKDPIFPMISEPPDKSEEEMANIKFTIGMLSPEKWSLWTSDCHLTAEEMLASKNGRPPFRYEKLLRDVAISSGLEDQKEGQAARGLIEALQAQILSRSFSDITNIYANVTSVGIYTLLFEESTADDSKWLIQKGTALLHRLTSFNSGVASQAHRQLSALDEGFRIALVITLSYSWSPVQWRTAALNADRLYEVTRIALRGPMFPESEPGQEERISIYCRLLLWILVTGMFSSQQERPDLERWFASRATAVAKKMQMHSYLELHRVMRQFNFQRTSYHASLCRLATCIASDDD